MGGFILTLLINLVLRYEYLIAAAVCILLHFTVGLPLFVLWTVLLLWILSALLITSGFSLLHRLGNVPSKPSGPNVNPYSVKNADLYAKTQDHREK